MWWPVQGCVNPENCEQVENPLFGFSKLVDHLDKMLATEQNTVIYYHCEHGHDRTSALTGAFMLKYMGKDLNDVLTQRPPNGAKAFKHAWEPNYEELVKYYASTISKEI
jgi:protein-tyrosine phosphatase